MSKAARDEFSESVKRALAERAAYICTNPTCRRPTVIPHSDVTKSLKTGKACHIRAAAPGGPRFDPAQAPDDRRSIQNAIWLCSECSDVIDKDEIAFPHALLLKWRTDHDAWIRNGGIVPELPKITLTTLHGLPLGRVPGYVTAEQVAEFREHRLCIHNTSAVEIKDIDLEVQLPEPVVHYRVEKPAGVEVVWEPIQMELRVLIKGGGRVMRGRSPLPSSDYRLQIDRIPSARNVEVSFISSLGMLQHHDMPSATPFDLEERGWVHHLVDGYFQFKYRGAMLRQRLCGRIICGDDKRTYSIPEVMPDFGEWKTVKRHIWS